MNPTLSRRERKKLETRQGLLEAALALFREKGYEATTVEEITEQADVAKGTFFNYFSSKEVLLDELAVWRVEQLRVALDVTEGAPASPVGRIKLLLRLLHQQHAHDLQLTRRALARRLCHPPSSPQGARRRRLFGFLIELVQEAQACGEIRADVKAELVSDLLRLLYFRQMATWSGGHDGEEQPVEYFEAIIDLLMDGMAGPHWRKS
jgi:AcrR family transcriptional regulator